MNGQTEKVASVAGRLAKLFGSAAVVVGWAAAFGLLAAQFASPRPLRADIEKVLAAPAVVQTAPVPSAVASRPVALNSRTDGS